MSKAEILNISLIGMAVRSATHLRVGQTCDVQLAHAAKTLRLPSTVMWARLVAFGGSTQGEAGPVYEIGFEFRDMVTGQARDLLRLLGETAVISLDTRVAGRFEASPGDAAELAASAGLLIRKISTGGLLVETTVRPEPHQELELVLELGAVPFACRGRVAYVEAPAREIGPAADGAEVSEQSPTLLGIEFVGLDESARRTLETFIAENLG